MLPCKYSPNQLQMIPPNAAAKANLCEFHKGKCRVRKKKHSCDHCNRERKVCWAWDKEGDREIETEIGR